MKCLYLSLTCQFLMDDTVCLTLMENLKDIDYTKKDLKLYDIGQALTRICSAGL